MEPTNGTALAIVPPSPISSASTQLEPSTAEQAFWLATQLAKSGLLGKSVQRPEAAFAVILAGRELGLTAMQSLRSIHVIEGKPSLSADLMVALVKRSPTCKFFKLAKSTNEVATYVTDRIGEGETEMSFTMEDARLAGVASKDNWRKYPAAMLRARCIAALARAVYPDLLAGIYEADSEEIAAAGRANKMPSSSGSDVVDAEISAEPTPEPIPTADWIAKFDAAKTADEIKALQTECKAAVTDEAALLEIGIAFKRALKRVKETTNG
jgi:hypothetical protein